MIQKKINSYFIIILFLGILNGFVSCNKDKDTQIGLNIIPESDNISFNCDTINVNCYTVTTEKIPIDNKKLIPLGSYADPIFGFSKASVALQLKLASSRVEFKAEKVNSIELHLKVQYAYGDTLNPQSININRLKIDLDNSKTYDSNYKLNSSDYELLQKSTFTYNPSDTSKIVKLQLPISLAEEFVNPNNAEHFYNDSVFMLFFKGLYLTTDNISEGGAVFTFAPLDQSSKMVMKYNDTSEFSFPIDSKCAILKMLEHDYSTASAELQNVLSDTTLLYDYSYVQGLAGLRTKIEIPELEKFRDSSNIAINRAKLVFNLKQNTQEDIYTPPPVLNLFMVYSDGTYKFIKDYEMNEDAFDGNYNSKNYTYSFNISLYIQNLLDTNKEALLYLVPMPFRNEGTPHRAVLHANADDEKRVKLQIYYSLY